MTGINDPLNWDLVRRQTYNATMITEGTYVPIPPIPIIAESHLMMFGFRNDLGKSTWRYAATVEMKLLTLPSSTSEFLASVAAFKQGCSLRELTLINFPDYGMLPFLAEVRIPQWHKRMFIEVWKYSGDKVDNLSQSLEILNRIESKIDAL